MAIPSEMTIEVLTSLINDPRNTVFIVSGRDGRFLEEHFGGLKGIGLSAEHGSFLRAPNSDYWVNLTETFDMSWMDDVEEIFRYYTEVFYGNYQTRHIHLPSVRQEVI